MCAMANLAIAGSLCVNGIAMLHTRLFRQDLFPELDALCPGKFNNKVNGMTSRCCLRACNPKLSALITKSIGDGWLREPRPAAPVGEVCRRRKVSTGIRDDQMQKKYFLLASFAASAVSRLFRMRFSTFISSISTNTSAKHLSLLHILWLYRRILQNPSIDVVPRVFVFSAKAAPGLRLGKGHHQVDQCGR